LLCHVLGVEPIGLASREVTDEEMADFDELLRQRLAGRPVQHLTGSAYFRHLKLAVGPGVFIPRPETEGLVQLVVDWIADQMLRKPLVVDLGTGSGAIAKSLAEETTARVVAIERDEQAFSYAEGNLAATTVELRLGDWGDITADLNELADVVITNPPYLEREANLPFDVLQDPAAALFAGTDGLDGWRSLLPVASRLLRDGGLLAGEHDDSQATAIRALVEADGSFLSVTSHQDLTGADRYLTAIK